MGLFQSTPFLHYSCLPGSVGDTANLIEYARVIHNIWVVALICFLFLRVESQDFLELCTYENCIFFLPVNICSVWCSNFLGQCLDIEVKNHLNILTFDSSLLGIS